MKCFTEMDNMLVAKMTDKDFKKLYQDLLKWIEWPAINRYLPPGFFESERLWREFLLSHDHACRCHRNARKLGRYFKVPIKNRKQAIRFLEKYLNYG